MSDSRTGAIGWIDLTVDNAEEIRKFYETVTGWRSSPVPMKDRMGDYHDHCLSPPETDNPVAGICHSRGSNANVPSSWIIYITVADLDASVASCVKLGGKIIDGPRSYGATARFCIIADPAGAVAALYSEKASS